MNQLQKLDPKIDFDGQKLSLKLMYYCSLIGYTISLIVGFYTRNLTYTLYIGVATVIFTFVVTIPSWPYFRRNPMKFKKEEKVKKE